MADITPKFNIISMRDKIVRTEDIFGRPFGEVFNGLRGSTTAFQRGSGDARVKSMGFGGQFVSVSPGDSIQEAIDFIDLSGGGVVFLKTGTHNSTTNITLVNNMQLIGEGSGQTTIDFGSTSSSVKAVGTSITTAGTVSTTNNSQTVTGSSTSFTSATANRDYILIGGIWYLITNIASDTSLTIQLPFATPNISGGDTLIATLVRDARIINLKISTSAVDGVIAQYTNEFGVFNVGFSSNSTGVNFDDSSNIGIIECDFAANSVDAININNCHYMDIVSTVAVDSLTNDNFKLTSCTNVVISKCASLNAADDGYNLTSCTNISIINSSSIEGGEQGIELVSGNESIAIKNCILQNNAGDAVKFTGTTDNSIVSGCLITNNGAYGVNIGASDCDENQILDNNYKSNTSGAIQDLGTGTVIR